MQVELKNASARQAGILFRRFFPEVDEAIAMSFESHVPDHKYSMAHLQGLFLMNKTDPLAVVELVRNE